MSRTLKEVIASLPASERTRIASRSRQLVAEELTLQALRKAVGKTQAATARRLGVGQHAISKIEARGDMFVSTLRGFIEAMGGELEILARFRDRPPVRIARLGSAAKGSRRRAAWRPIRSPRSRTPAGAREL